MRKSRGLRIDPCGTPLDTLAGWENGFPRLTKNVLFMRSKPNYWIFRATNSIQFLH